jgi:hypothetical protein
MVTQQQEDAIVVTICMLIYHEEILWTQDWKNCERQEMPFQYRINFNTPSACNLIRDSGIRFLKTMLYYLLYKLFLNNRQVGRSDAVATAGI